MYLYLPFLLNKTALEKLDTSFSCSFFLPSFFKAAPDHLRKELSTLRHFRLFLALKTTDIRLKDLRLNDLFVIWRLVSFLHLSMSFQKLFGLCLMSLKSSISFVQRLTSRNFLLISETFTKGKKRRMYTTILLERRTWWLMTGLELVSGSGRASVFCFLYLSPCEL